VRYNTTLGDDDTTKELVQLFVVADGELQVARNDTNIEASIPMHRKTHTTIFHAPLLFVITCRIARELENLSGKVFKDRGEVDGCTSTDTLRIVATLEHTVDTTDGELETRF
jgi:hypothetical protein